MTKAELIAENEKLKARIAELEAALKKALAQLEAKGRAGKITPNITRAPKIR